MKRTSMISLAMAALAAGSWTIGCDDTPSSPDVDPIELQLDSLLAYATPFQNLSDAMEAGFNTQVTECRENPPAGGMGFHYANLDRIDGAQPTVLEPEILVFAPDGAGGNSLGAVEYIVPYALWEDANPPVLFDEAFHRNDTDEVWMLHVWLFRENPAGLFADWNPAVSCS